MEKVTCFPNDGTPEVIPGIPQAADIVRVKGKYKYYTPPSVISVKPVVMNRKQLRTYIVAQLGGNGSGSAQLQTYLEAVQNNAGSTNADKNARLALDTIRRDDEFTKDEVAAYLLALGFSTQHRQTIQSNWPTE